MIVLEVISPPGYILHVLRCLKTPFGYNSIVFKKIDLKRCNLELKLINKKNLTFNIFIKIVQEFVCSFEQNGCCGLETFDAYGKCDKFGPTTFYTLDPFNVFFNHTL
jgi:hypothetical protein